MEQIVKDALGNVLNEGNLCYWVKAGAVVKILGFTSEGKGAKIGEARLEMTVPFQFSQPETFLKDFVAVVDPAETAKVAGLMKAG